MKKLTLILAVVLAASCSSKKNNAEAEAALTCEQTEQQIDATQLQMTSPIEITALEQDYQPLVSEDNAAGYAYKWVSFATDFAREGKTLNGTYNGLALTFVGEPFQFRFQVESFDADGNAKDNICPVYWLNGQHTDPVLTTLDGSTVANTCNEETTVYFELPAEITERFADGNAGMHIHFGDQGSAGDLVISKAYLFQVAK